jgi:hypothetical protein
MNSLHSVRAPNTVYCISSFTCNPFIRRCKVWVTERELLNKLHTVGKFLVTIGKHVVLMSAFTVCGLLCHASLFVAHLSRDEPLRREPRVK